MTPAMGHCLGRCRRHYGSGEVRTRLRKGLPRPHGALKTLMHADYMATSRPAGPQMLLRALDHVPDRSKAGRPGCLTHGPARRAAAYLRLQLSLRVGWRWTLRRNAPRLSFLLPLMWAARARRRPPRDRPGPPCWTPQGVFLKVDTLGYSRSRCRCPKASRQCARRTFPPPTQRAAGATLACATSTGRGRHELSALNMQRIWTSLGGSRQRPRADGQARRHRQGGATTRTLSAQTRPAT